MSAAARYYSRARGEGFTAAERPKGREEVRDLAVTHPTGRPSVLVSGMASQGHYVRALATGNCM